MKKDLINIKFLKGNQLVLLVVGLMLVTAGYLNYTTGQKEESVSSLVTKEDTYAGIGDATLVNGGALVENDDVVSNTYSENTVATKTEESSISTESNKSDTEEKESSVETSTKQDTNDYYTESKLQREKMYSQMLESYQKMLDSNTVSEEQKAIAQTEIKRINDNNNAIMIAENLITTKGFNNVLVFINDESVSVVVNEENLTKEQTAQIQNIISREMKADIDDIHISTK